MNETMQTFLDEGLDVYAKARATLTFFEDEIGGLLSTAVERREEWPLLETHKILRPEWDEGDGQDGYWVLLNIEAFSHRKEQVVIECGIWWNAFENVNPIIYGCFHEPKNNLIFSWTKQEQGIQTFIYWEKRHLYLPVTKSTDIRDALNKVLDELLKQLK
jgi:hypothetical protein